MHGRYEIYAQNSGFFVQETQIGQEVKPGQRLGILKGLDGRTCEEISSTDGGVCLLVMTNPVKTAGDLLYKILRYE
jgi:predicted deacylase